MCMSLSGAFSLLDCSRTANSAAAMMLSSFGVGAHPPGKLFEEESRAATPASVRCSVGEEAFESSSLASAKVSTRHRQRESFAPLLGTRRAARQIPQYS